MLWSGQAAHEMTMPEADLPEGTALSNAMPGEHRGPVARILAADFVDDVEVVLHETTDCVTF